MGEGDPGLWNGCLLLRDYHHREKGQVDECHPPGGNERDDDSRHHREHVLNVESDDGRGQAVNLLRLAGQHICQIAGVVLRLIEPLDRHLQNLQEQVLAQLKRQTLADDQKEEVLEPVADQNRNRQVDIRQAPAIHIIAPGFVPGESRQRVNHAREGEGSERENHARASCHQTRTHKHLEHGLVVDEELLGVVLWLGDSAWSGGQLLLVLELLVVERNLKGDVLKIILILRRC